jgi:hypothetical protein
MRIARLHRTASGSTYQPRGPSASPPPAREAGWDSHTRSPPPLSAQPVSDAQSTLTGKICDSVPRNVGMAAQPQVGFLRCARSAPGPQGRLIGRLPLVVERTPVASAQSTPELPLTCSLEPEVEFEPTTFRLSGGYSASTSTAPDGSGLLKLEASSVQTALDGSRRIVWMIKRMIEAHPIETRMACRWPWSCALGFDEVVVRGHRCGSGRRGARRSLAPTRERPAQVRASPGCRQRGRR